MLQGNLAEISARESDALAENALEQQRLAIAYRNAVQQAQASGNSALAQALYQEYVRQDEAAQAAALAAQEQANWEAQFGFTQQQYGDSLDADNRNYAYNLAMTMLEAGIMPDSSTLEAAGISSGDALNIQQSVLQAQDTPTSNRTSGGSSGSSGNRTSSGSGTSSSSGGNGIESGMNEAYFNAAMRSIATRLQSNNNLETLSDAVNDIWPRMSTTQRAQLQQLLERYGIAYEE